MSNSTTAPVVSQHTYTHLAGTVKASAQSGEGREKCWVIVALDGVERLDGGQGSFPFSMEVDESPEIHDVERVFLVLRAENQRK